MMLAGLCFLIALLPQFPAVLAADDAVVSCSQACAQLSSELGSAVHMGGDDPNFAIWDMKQQEVQPACRVEPTTAIQVSRVVEVAVENWCRFAIKGGGHMTNLDASNSVGGITLDLHLMKHIEIAEDRAWADLGPGWVLQEAYIALERHNLTFVGGRTADVGLPGYTLGGGISNLGPQYGLAADNVFEYELVLPNATIVNVSETAHPDLYFALRGGGNNFGVVTNFRSRIVPQGQIMGGSTEHHANFTDQIVEQVHQLATTKAGDTRMSFACRYYYDSGDDTFKFNFLQAYVEPVLEPPVFEELRKIPAESSNIRIDWVSNHSVDSVSPHGFRRVYASITFRPSQSFHKQILDIFSQELEGIKATPGLSTSVIVQALHLNAIKATKQRGGSAIGVESDEPLMVTLLTLGWSSAEDDSSMYAFADRWLDRSKAVATELGLLHPWIYLNYANYNQDPFAGYGEANKARLQEIQKAIDPRGVFTSEGLVRGSFKLH